MARINLHKTTKCWGIHISSATSCIWEWALVYQRFSEFWWIHTGENKL